MTDPRLIPISDYDYDLPPENIALHPLEIRDASRLLVYQQARITEDVFNNISSHLPPSSLLLLNDTRVVEARLLFQKTTGGVIEIFCLGPDARYRDIQDGLQQEGKVFWHCLVGGASKWKKGQVLQLLVTPPAQEPFVLEARYIKKSADDFIIELSWSNSALRFAEVLHFAGNIPLPPYLHRQPGKEDETRYQTTYAQEEGSVAAPTAGLHFTPAVFESLESKNIKTSFITLHVGAGTFQPVKSERVGEHHMHEEFFTVPRPVIEELIRRAGQDITCVGTTTLRTIESLYWMGMKSENDDYNRIHQWEPYEQDEVKPVKEVLTSLLERMDRDGLTALHGSTSILIAPGYLPRIANGLITNFHLPKSTLLLLIAAWVGEDWKSIYNYALKNQFRFLSYGDGSLLWTRNRV